MLPLGRLVTPALALGLALAVAQTPTQPGAPTVAKPPKPVGKSKGKKPATTTTRTPFKTTTKATPKSATTKAKQKAGAKAAAKSKSTTKKPVRQRGQLQPTTERYKEIEQALADRGYLTEEPTGKWGPASVEALRSFQADNELPATGRLDSLSLIHLGLGPTLTAAGSASGAAQNN